MDIWAVVEGPKVEWWAGDWSGGARKATELCQGEVKRLRLGQGVAWPWWHCDDR